MKVLSLDLPEIKVIVRPHLSDSRPIISETVDLIHTIQSLFKFISIEKSSFQTIKAMFDSSMGLWNELAIDPKKITDKQQLIAAVNNSTDQIVNDLLSEICQLELASINPTFKKYKELREVTQLYSCLDTVTDEKMLVKKRLMFIGAARKSAEKLAKEIGEIDALFELFNQYQLEEKSHTTEEDETAIAELEKMLDKLSVDKNLLQNYTNNKLLLKEIFAKISKPSPIIKKIFDLLLSAKDKEKIKLEKAEKARQQEESERKIIAQKNQEERLKNLTARYQAVLPYLDQMDITSWQESISAGQYTKAEKLLSNIELTIINLNKTKKEFEQLKKFFVPSKKVAPDHNNSSSSEIKKPASDFEEIEACLSDIHPFSAKKKYIDEAMKRMREQLEQWKMDRQNEYDELAVSYKKLFTIPLTEQLSQDFKGYLENHDQSGVANTLNFIKNEIAVKEERLIQEQRKKFEAQQLELSKSHIENTTYVIPTTRLESKIEYMMAIDELKGEDDLLSKLADLKAKISTLKQDIQTKQTNMRDVSSIAKSLTIYRQREKDIEQGRTQFADRLPALEFEFEEISEQIGNKLQETFNRKMREISGDLFKFIVDINSFERSTLGYFTKEGNTVTDEKSKTELPLEIKQAKEKLEQFKKEIGAKHIFIQGINLTEEKVKTPTSSSTPRAKKKVNSETPQQSAFDALEELRPLMNLEPAPVSPINSIDASKRLIINETFEFKRQSPSALEGAPEESFVSNTPNQSDEEESEEDIIEQSDEEENDPTQSLSVEKIRGKILILDKAKQETVSDQKIFEQQKKALTNILTKYSLNFAFSSTIDNQISYVATRITAYRSDRAKTTFKRDKANAIQRLLVTLLDNAKAERVGEFKEIFETLKNDIAEFKARASRDERWQTPWLSCIGKTHMGGDYLKYTDNDKAFIQNLEYTTQTINNKLISMGFIKPEQPKTYDIREDFRTFSKQLKGTEASNDSKNKATSNTKTLKSKITDLVRETETRINQYWSNRSKTKSKRDKAVAIKTTLGELSALLDVKHGQPDSHAFQQKLDTLRIQAKEFNEAAITPITLFGNNNTVNDYRYVARLQADINMIENTAVEIGVIQMPQLRASA